MNRERVEGNRKPLEDKLEQRWGQLTDDDLDLIAGKCQQLAGEIQKRHGIAKERAEREINAFCHRQ